MPVQRGRSGESIRAVRERVQQPDGVHGDVSKMPVAIVHDQVQVDVV